MTEEPELVETETVEAELVVYEGEAQLEQDLRGAESEAQLDKVVREHIVNDLETALNLVRNYQLLLRRSFVPDLHFDEAHPLLAKYRMPSIDPLHLIYDPGHGDISTHTTSIPGEAEEIGTELEAGSSNQGQELDTRESSPEALQAMHERRAERPILEPERPDEKYIAQLRREGYEDCPICDGTGKATKGVLKGKTCSRCGGYGLWQPPETIELVSDEDGNIGIRSTGDHLNE